MKDIFVPIEIAVKLNEIGFDEPCIFHYYKDEVLIDLTDYVERQYIYFEEIEFSNHNNYDNQISAPTWEQAFKWFREKGYYFHINYFPHSHLPYWFSIEQITISQESYKTYEECREVLVLKMIEIYKENEKYSEE